MMRARRACQECRTEDCRTRRVLVLDSSQGHATTSARRVGVARCVGVHSVPFHGVSFGIATCTSAINGSDGTRDLQMT
eukprot:2303362-Prymnesium_polylepis.1